MKKLTLFARLVYRKPHYEHPVHHTALETMPNTGTSNESDTRLYGRWLILARILWATMTLFILCLFVVAIPVRFHELQHICMQGVCNELQLVPGDISALKELPFSLNIYAAYIIPLEVAYTLSYVLIAAIIFWRRSDDWLALFVSLTLVALGATLPPVIAALVKVQPAWHYPALFVQELAPTCLMAFLFLFPNGRFVPRWTALFVAGWIVWSLIRPLFIQSTPFALGQLENFAMMGLFVLGVLAQLYRYYRVSTSWQRQQTKWVVFSLSVLVLGGVVYLLIHLLFAPLNQPGLGHILGNMISVPVCLTIPGLLVSLALGLAILRYRLWDIDLLINRTLVYTSLTATLAFVYLGLVLLLQRAFFLLTGQQQSEPVLVVSTLIIAALFQPLRGRIQTIIDRRFYRRKYDATRIITAFSETLSREVDLDQLSEHILAVVQETMQPSQVSLWLRSSVKQEGRKTRALPEFCEVSD